MKKLKLYKQLLLVEGMKPGDRITDLVGDTGFGDKFYKWVEKQGLGDYRIDAYLRLTKKGIEYFAANGKPMPHNWYELPDTWEIFRENLKEKI